jgi:dTDP-4-dehydrorhamnose reductase
MWSTKEINVEIAVTGHKGTIGSRLVKRGYTPLDCDITNFHAVRDTVLSVNPDVIVHCAAKTSVAWCENNEKEAYLVNARSVSHVLDAFAGKFIYLSTVHVFNGKRYFDYSEKHEPNSVNVYGLTKLAGEQIVSLWDNPYVIARVSRTFDEESLESNVVALDNSYGPSLDFPTFIKRSFVHADHLVEGIAWIAENKQSKNGGIVNIAGTHTFSYYDFWIQVARVFGIDEKRIEPRKHEIEDYPRPFRGGLNVNKARKMGVPLYSAIDGLELIKESL